MNTPHIDVTAIDGIIQLQGQQVLVKRGGHPDRIFKLVHSISEKDGKSTRELRMVYRVKGKPSVDWPVRQALFDSAKPVTGADDHQWQLSVK